MMYKVTRDGQVISPRLGKPMKLQMHQNGYYNVQVRVNGKPTTKYVHRMVAEEYIPNPDNKPEVNHINEDKLDNMVENLEWVTSKENLRHSAKLSYMAVEVIKEAWSNGHSQSAIARHFNVVQPTIWAVINKQIWH